MSKPIIYQMLPRLWGNLNRNIVKGGALDENSTGKFSNIDSSSLDYLKWLGVDYVWYTGIIRHSTKSNDTGVTPSHPQFVKGEAGSPYAISNYFEVNSYLADDPNSAMKEFEDLIKRTHDKGLKLIIDFVPNHVARDYSDAHGGCKLGEADDKTLHWSKDNDFFYFPGEELVLPNNETFLEEVASLKARDFQREYKILPAWLVKKAKSFDVENYIELLAQYNNYLQLYSENPAKATGNNCFRTSPTTNDWYETIKLNYGEEHSPTWDKMYEILRFWAAKGVDGFRCDMVELVPYQFFQWAIKKLNSEYPNVIFIAEVYKKELYRKYVKEVGFDYLYDKSGLYDCLRAIVRKNLEEGNSNVELWQSTTGITRNWQFLGDMQPYMLNFLENHDEQRFCSEYFGQSSLNKYPALAISLLFNTSAFMIYAGEEAGEVALEAEGFSGADGRTTIFDWWSSSSLRKIYRLIHSEDYMRHFADSQVNGSISEDLSNLFLISGFTKEEANLFYNFVNLIRFSASSNPITKGTIYDLCYSNVNSFGFNKDRHFAFLRDYEDETLLIVANFSNEQADTKLFIPEHAFEWMELKITDNLAPSIGIDVNLAPKSYKIIKLS